MKKTSLIVSTLAVCMFLLSPIYIAEADVYKDEKTHWARQSVQYLQTIGYLNAPSSLNSTVDAYQWEQLVLKIFAPTMKDNRDEEFLYWIHAYTHIDEDIVTRDNAVGGLVKLLIGAKKASGAYYGKDDRLVHFTDSKKISDKNFALWHEGVRLGLIKGYPNNTLAPQNSLTFGEAATILERTYEILYK